MISKLITTGKDRSEAMSLMEQALKEYVIRGPGHNLGFGISIVNHEKFIEGDYDTAFIPKYYEKGYSGEEFGVRDNMLVALMAAKLRNLEQE